MRWYVVAPVLMRIPLDGAASGKFMVAEVDLADVAGVADVDLVADDGSRRSVQALRTLAETFDGLEPALTTIVTRLRKATRGPDEITVEFGLKFGGETGVIFAKGKVETALQVTVTWSRGSAESKSEKVESKSVREAEAESADES
jgi:hypothetical protein